MIIKVGKGFILININTGMGGGSVWFFAFFSFQVDNTNVWTTEYQLSAAN